MKLLFTTLLVLTFTSLQGQKLKDNLQGDWVCMKIVDANGKETSGKFGGSSDYLKFSFEKGNLTIVEAPFDRGIKMPIKFRDNNIDLFPNAIYELPERKYDIVTLTKDSLVLSAKNKSGVPISYYFRNQKLISNDVNLNDRILDLGQILIKHLKLQDGKGFNRVSSYTINNNIENLFPCPLFNDAASATLSDYVSINFVFPNDFALDKLSDELIVRFEVSKNGATDISIEKGLTEKIDSSIKSILEKSRNKWNPIIVNGEPINSTFKLHFVFYLGRFVY